MSLATPNVKIGPMKQLTSDIEIEDALASIIIEDAVTTAIKDGAETHEELYTSINANVNVTGYDVDEIGDLLKARFGKLVTHLEFSIPVDTNSDKTKLRSLLTELRSIV